MVWSGFPVLEASRKMAQVSFVKTAADKTVLEKADKETENRIKLLNGSCHISILYQGWQKLAL